MVPAFLMMSFNVQKSNMVKVNLGCGNRFINDWINIDFVSNYPEVKQYDLRSGIPLDTGSAEIIYHSHILEHFNKQAAISFLKECFRVLKQGGILRVVVPDLEQLARQYLAMLETVEKEESELNIANYNWAAIELFDQMVREKPGGEMIQYWLQKEIINQDLLERRLGHEFASWRKMYIDSLNKSGLNQGISLTGKNPSLLERISNKWKRYWLQKWRINKADIETGSFRNAGEPHKWMYDSYSLTFLLKSIGFNSVHKVTAFESNIPGWDQYQILDTEGGNIRKPDSIFIEAIKG